MSKPDRLAKSLVDSCMELHRRRTWNRVEGDAPFLLHVPEEDEPLAGVLMGQAGEEFGLLVSRGPDALDRLYSSLMRGDSDRPDSEGIDILSATFERLGEIPDELRGPLRKAGFQTRRENIAPFLFAKPAHRQTRAVNKREMKTLLWCLRAVFAAEDQGELRATPLSPGSRVLELEVSGHIRAPEVKTRFVRWSASAVGGRATSVLLPADLRKLPRTGESWLATAPPMPGRIKGDDRAWKALILCERESGRVIEHGVVPSGEAAGFILPLAKALRERGLPREIDFAEESLFDILAPGLAALGVKTRLDPESPWFEQLREALVEGMEHSTERAGRHADPETLAEWKEAEREFCSRQIDLVERKSLITPRAIKRYFGSEEDAEEVMAELGDLAPFPALLEWFLVDYRPTARSKTLLERHLQGRDLTPTDRTLIEARQGAFLSIFRVDSVQVGASFEVEDLIDGERYTVQDRAMSGCGIEGYFLPLRLMQVAEWTFPLVAGPVLSAFHVERMIRRLESIGFVLGREGKREEAHLMGRLWPWLLEVRDVRPQLQNTDGDPFEMQRASFHVADPPALVKALERRRDISIDDPGATWVWLRDGGPAPGSDGETVLGRFELLGGTLLLEVNSTRRLEQARRWVEKLPGVRFERATPIALDELPLDDRLPGPPPEPFSDEVRDQIAAMILEQNRRWLDESVPALGGLTPRAACATKEGRRQVARLIRSMPPAQIPGGTIPAPREELLRELGLDRP